MYCYNLIASILFLVLQSKLEEVKEIGPKTYAQYDKVRVFILISSVLTWALTKPMDPVNTCY